MSAMQQTVLLQAQGQLALQRTPAVHMSQPLWQPAHVSAAQFFGHTEGSDQAPGARQALRQAHHTAGPSVRTSS
jgi:hypothetical protein